MSTFPSSVRMQAIYDVGVKIDDVLEKAQLDTSKREGAHETYVSAATSFTTLMSQIDMEHAGREADVAKLWMSKVVAICHNMASYTNIQVHTARGAENQTKLIVDMVKKLYDQEVERKEEEASLLQQAVEESLTQDEVNENHLIMNESTTPTASQFSSSHIRSRTIKEQRQRINTTPQ